MSVARKAFLLASLFYAFGTYVVKSEEASLQSEEAAPAALPAHSPAVIHKLIIAAQSNVVITEARADQLIQTMNTLIKHAENSCANITFVRVEPIHYNANLLQFGEVSDIEASLNLHEPTANVMAVTAMSDCNGTPMASGCAPVGSKSSAMVVVDDGPTRGPVVWVHERGHVMGLPHIAQGVEQNQATQAQLDNIMYWYALEAAHLLMPYQCSAYLSTKHSMVVAAAAPAAVTDSAGNTAPSTPPAAQAAPAAPSVHEIIPATLTKAASNVLFVNSWVHGMPLAAVRELSAEDVESVAKTIAIGDPVPQWENMLAVLAYKKYEKFMSIADSVLVHPNVEVPTLGNQPSQSASEVFEQKSSQQRALIRAKLFVPKAIGIYAYGTGNMGAASVLGSLANPNSSRNIVGGELADAVSGAAVTGLAIASAKEGDEPRNNIGALSQRFLRPTKGPNNNVFGNTPFQFSDAQVKASVEAAAPAAGIVVDEKKMGKANTVFEAVKEKGLDGYILTGSQ